MNMHATALLLTIPASDQQMSEYDLKLLLARILSTSAKTLTNGPFGKYAQKL